jgi:hypothetical protein
VNLHKLLIAIKLKRLIISNDKNTFLNNSKANSKDHFGIILITRQHTTITSINKLTNDLINKYLNKYTADEFKNLIVYL